MEVEGRGVERVGGEGVEVDGGVERVDGGVMLGV